MRVMNLGLRITQQTTLQVALPAPDPTAMLRIGLDGRFSARGFQGDRTSVVLLPGDYVITLDAAQPASPDAPYRLTSDVDAIYMTAGPPQDDAPPLVVGVGRVIALSDPKNPWPPSLVFGATPAETSFLVTSPILPAMRTLIDAFTGKGGDGAPAPAIHALLIGIDGYPAGADDGATLYGPLRGCVRDILEVEHFLREAGVPAERITRLIAPGRGGAGRELPVAPETLPTYANIVAAWKRVTATAGKGDVVYIHYSGHGGRTSAWFPELKSNGLDESIAPCDVNLATGRHLRDVEIAALLDDMARRELLTTLVLDSCYAGSATRDEVQARSGDRDDLRRRPGRSADTSAVASRAELEAIARKLASTPRGADESWRIGPGAAALTTVIAACRPHESSYEYAVDGKQRGGALTHFWLETLRQRGAALTYRAAYRQTFARVQAVFKGQSPVLLGAADRLVLGTATLVQPASIAVLEVHGDQVALAAGASGLLALGTRLAVLPGEVLPELVDLTAMPQIEVTSVQAARSRARVVAGAGNGPPIAPGSQAVIVRYAPTMRREVRWMAAQPLSAAELAARSALEAEIAADATHAIGLAAGDGAHFQIAIEDSRFVVLDPAGNPLPNLGPDIAVTDAGAARRVKQRLVHLARFHNVRELTSSDPNSPLAGKLELSLHAVDRDRPAPAALPVHPVLPCDSEFFLRIRNRSTRPLSLAILDLAPDWSIEHINRGAPLLVEAGQSLDLRMATWLPDGHSVGNDVLKVIGTLDQAEFDWLTLPPIDPPDAPNRVTRGPRNAFEALMAMMHEPSHAARGVTIASSPSFGWTEAQIGLEVRR